MPVLPTCSRRSTLLSAAAFGLFLGASPVIASQSSAATDNLSRRKINLAGRQRMLSQRIGRAVFFLALGVDKPRHLALLGQAREVYDHTLRGLRDGNAAQGLIAEESALVLEKLTAVDGVWGLFDVVIRDVVERETVTDADVQYVARFNLDLLKASNAVVKALVSEYGDKSTDMGLAIAIDVAGRQRMLSQKMAKEAAMVALGLSVEATCGKLEQTIALFDGSLTALMEGLPTITLPAPPPDIRAKLAEVRALWHDYQRPVRLIAETGVASQIDLAAISAQSDPVLSTMNDAVGLYETM